MKTYGITVNHKKWRKRGLAKNTNISSGFADSGIKTSKTEML